MKGIKGTAAYDYEGKAPAYSQDYNRRNKVRIVVARSDGRRKLVAVSKKTYLKHRDEKEVGE